MQRTRHTLLAALLTLTIVVAVFGARPAHAAEPCQNFTAIGQGCLVAGSIRPDPTQPHVFQFEVRLSTGAVRTFANACDDTARRWVQQNDGAWWLLSQGMPVDPLYNKIDAAVCHVPPKPKATLNLPAGFVSFHCALDDCASIQNAWAYAPATVRDIVISSQQFGISSREYRTFEGIIGGQRSTVAVDCSTAPKNHFLAFPITTPDGHAIAAGNAAIFQRHTFGGEVFHIACEQRQTQAP